MENDRNRIILVVVIVVAAAAVAAGGYMVMSGNGEGQPTDGEDGTDGTDDGDGSSEFSGTETYSGTWSGSGFEGKWEFTVDFDDETVTGSFSGDASGDISGTVSDGEISAEGNAAFGAISWSGSFNADATEISGTWEDVPTEGSEYSGTWSGSLGEADDSTNGTDDGTNGEDDTTNGEDGEEDTPSTVTSIDATWKDFKSGEMTGGVRIRARNMDSDKYDWRVESLDEDKAAIYNDTEKALYITDAGNPYWTKITEDFMDAYMNDVWKDWVATTADWAIEYGEVGETTVTYGDQSVTISINMVNGSLDDSIFTPPEDAEVKEMDVSTE